MPDTTCVLCHRILDGDTIQEDTAFIEEFEYPSSLNIHICRDCARKERVQSAIRKYAPFMEKFSQLCNDTLLDHDGVLSEALVSCFFSQHRFLQNEMLTLIWKLLGKVGKVTGNGNYVDGRNEIMINWAKKASDAIQ